MKLQKTTKEAEQKTLVKKLVEIRASLGKVEKTKRNPHFGYNYVGLEQLNALLQPKLSEHNIWMSSSVVSEVVHYGDGKAGVFSNVSTEHVFVDGDSDQQIVLKSAGLGWDAGDKATPKAITAAVKSFLKANFMISDEADDPEAHGEQPPAADKPKHSRTKQYEEETGEGDHKVATDLLELKAFLTEHKIPDGFLLRMLQEKKLIDGHTKTVAGIKPGILRRCLSDKSKENLVASYKQHVADEDSGSQTAPARTYDSPEEAFDAEHKPNDKKEVRTREGDQSLTRTPIMEDILPEDLLAQENHEDWRTVKIHWGKDEGKTLGSLTVKNLHWWVSNWHPKPFKGTWNDKDLLLDAALCLASSEMSGE